MPSYARPAIRGPFDAVAVSRAVARRAGRSDGALAASLVRGDLVRPLRGAYVDPRRAAAPEAFYRFAAADAVQAAAHAAAAVLPPAAALCDETAAFVLCGLWPPDTRPRMVVPAPSTGGRRRGIVIREAELSSGDVLLTGSGLRVTDGTRTALDLARRLPRPDALVALDALLHARVTSPEQLAAGVDAWAGHRGVLQARALIVLADGRAESPGESRIRLALLDAGLGPVAAQAWMCDGRFRVDLLVRERLIVEFEGAHHRGEATWEADRLRSNALAACGLPVLRFVHGDLRRLEAVVREVAAVVA